MNIYLKYALITLGLINIIPSLIVLCQSGPEQALSVLLLMPVLLFFIVLYSTLVLCMLPPIWIAVAWYYFGKQ